MTNNVFKVGNNVKDRTLLASFYHHMYKMSDNWREANVKVACDVDMLVVESVVADGHSPIRNARGDIINLIVYADSPIQETVTPDDIAYSMKDIGELLLELWSNTCFQNDVLTARLPGREPVIITAAISDTATALSIGKALAEAPVRESEVIATAVREAAAAIESVFRHGDSFSPADVEETILDRINKAFKEFGLNKG